MASSGQGDQPRNKECSQVPLYHSNNDTAVLLAVGKWAVMKLIPGMHMWETKCLPLLDLMSTKVTLKKGVLQVNDSFTSGLMTLLSMSTYYYALQFSYLVFIINWCINSDVISLALDTKNIHFVCKEKLSIQSHSSWYRVTGLHENRSFFRPQLFSSNVLFSLFHDPFLSPLMAVMMTYWQMTRGRLTEHDWSPSHCTDDGTGWTVERTFHSTVGNGGLSASLPQPSTANTKEISGSLYDQMNILL